MAFLNSELIFYLSLVFLVSRIGRYTPFGQWLLKGLTFYTAPQERTLSEILPREHKRAKEDTKRLEAQQKAAALPQTSEQIVDFYANPIRTGIYRVFDFNNLHMYGEYELLSFVVLTSILLFCFGEIWSCVRGTPPQEMSFFGILLLFGAGLKSLASILIKFGFMRVETQLSLFFGFSTMFVALLMFRVPNNILEFQFDAGIQEATSRKDSFMRNLKLGLDVEPWIFATQFAVSCCAAFISALTVLPALRWAYTYIDVRAQLAKSGTIWNKIMLRVSFTLPVLACALWVKPLFAWYTIPPQLVSCSVESPWRDCILKDTALSTEANNSDQEVQTVLATHDNFTFEYWQMTESQFLSLRLWIVLLAIGMRLWYLRPFLNSYLYTARTNQIKMIQQLYTTLASKQCTPAALHTALQEKCGRTLRSLCIAALQILAPSAFVLALVGMVLRKGDVALGLCSLYQTSMDKLSPYIGISASTFYASDPTKLSSVDNALEQLYALIFDRFGVSRTKFASAALWRPVFSFLLWWSLLVWVLMVFGGLFYYQFVASASKIISATDEEETGTGATQTTKQTSNKNARHKGKKQRNRAKEEKRLTAESEQSDSKETKKQK